MKLVKIIKNIINYLFLILVGTGANIIGVYIALDFYSHEKSLNTPLWKIWIALVAIMCFIGVVLGFIFSNKNKIFLFNN